MLACADVDEGVDLRDAGVRAPILVFGALGISDLEGIFTHRLTPTISSPWAGRALAEAAAARDTVLDCHVKIDTGMNRLGLRHDNLRRTLPAILAAPSLRVGALYTHFATADDPESEHFPLQQQNFIAARDVAADLGLRTTHAHAANSAALLRDERVWFDAVRPGPAPLRHRPAAADVDAGARARVVAPFPHRRRQGRARWGSDRLRTGVPRRRSAHARRRACRVRRRPRLAAGQPRCRPRARPPRPDRRPRLDGHDLGRRHRSRRRHPATRSSCSAARARSASTSARSPPRSGRSRGNCCAGWGHAYSGNTADERRTQNAERRRTANRTPNVTRTPNAEATNVSSAGHGTPNAERRSAGSAERRSRVGPVVPTRPVVGRARSASPPC